MSSAITVTGQTITQVSGTSPIASSGGTSPNITLNGTATPNQILMSSSLTTTAYSSATYPATTTINKILYSSANNTIAEISTANSGILITSAGGVPSISSTLPLAVQGNITDLGAVSAGSLAAGFTPVTVPIGGTGNTTFTAYSLICAGTTATGIFQNVVGVGTTGQLLISAGAAALPAWTTATYPSTTTINQILYSSANNVVGGITAANSASLVTSSSGVPAMTASMTNGQIVLGSTGATPTPGTITSTTGIVVTTGAASLALDLPIGISGINLLYNTNFQLYQRAAQTITSGANTVVTYVASTTTYTLDRWQVLCGASQAIAITQVPVNHNGGEVFVQRQNGQTGTGTIRFCQSLPIDACINLASKVLTLSFRGVAGANYSATSSALVVNVYTGTGTSSISGINGAFTGNATQSNTFTISTTPTNFSVTLSALGSTINQVAVEFAFTPTGTAGANDFFGLRWVKLEVGATATTQQDPSMAADLIACRPFYWKTFALATAPAQNAGTGTGEMTFPATRVGALTSVSPRIFYPQPMFASPSITLYSPAASTAQAYDETATAVCTATSTVNANQNGFHITTTGAVGTAIGNVIGVHVTAEAELT